MSAEENNLKITNFSWQIDFLERNVLEDDYLGSDMEILLILFPSLILLLF